MIDVVRSMNRLTDKTVCAVLLAAGASTRMGENKLLMRFFGKTPIELCLNAFSEFADEIIIAVSEQTREAALEAARACSIKSGKTVKLVDGGARRQDSVLNALTATYAEIVSIHDCARCLVTNGVRESSIATAAANGCGIASVPVADTLRNRCTGETVDRDALLAAQTPQTFFRQALIEAYAEVGADDFTDDAAIYAAAGKKLFFSEGSSSNIKLTCRSDVEVVRAILSQREAQRDAGGENAENADCASEICSSDSACGSLTPFRIGFGEDTHRLKEGRRLILGGVHVPCEFGLDGHSDADALTHALIDAVLGACALGDIGMHFPDSDMRYKGINSILLAEHAAALVRKSGFEIANLDATVVAQRPKLGGYRDEMRARLAEAFGVDEAMVSVKYTTPEHTGPEGRGESMTVRACALVAARPR